MAFHCRCGLKTSECDYPNCKNGELDARKPEPLPPQYAYNVLTELRRQIDAALEKLGGA